MKILVISLAGSLQRRKNAARQLDRCGLDYEFFDALDGDAGNSEFVSRDDTSFELNTGRRPTSGEVGCYASHRTLWCRCARSSEPYVILEDDFSLGANFCAALDQVQRLIGRYGYIRLQTERRGRKVRERKAGIFTLYRYTKMPHSALCYAISPRVGAALAAKSVTMDAPIDVFIKQFWIHRQPLYGLAPYPADEHALSKSTNITGRDKTRKALPMALKRQWGKMRDRYLRARCNRAFSKHNTEASD